MSTAPVEQPAKRISFEEYLRREAESEVKHDYIDGQSVAMAGGTAEHSLMIANIGREAGNRLKGKPCRVYDSNLLVGIPRKTYAHYPDASIV